MQSRQFPAFFVSIVLATLVIVIDGGCKDSDTISAPRVVPTPRLTISTPTPTPSAAPAGDVSGSWTGTFDSADPVDCDSNTPAHATFTQVGSTVAGTLDATENFCGFTGVAFQGTLHGSTLAGSVTGDRFQNATATGRFSGTTLELSLSNGSGSIPGGSMHLHR